MPLNIRHSKLATKQLYKIKDMYYNEYIYINRETDFEIDEPSKLQK